MPRLDLTAKVIAKREKTYLHLILKKEKEGDVQYGKYVTRPTLQEP